MPEDRREPTNVRFGANLRALREQKGISQDALAAEMTERGHRWLQQTVTRIEAGLQSLRAPELEALASIMGATLDRFTWGTAEANESEFVYASGSRLRQQYEVVAEAVCRMLAEETIAERTVRRHKDSEWKRVQVAVDDVMARMEVYHLDAAVNEGISRYEERVQEQERMDKESADDAQGES